MTVYAKRELAVGLRAVVQHEEIHWISIHPPRWCMNRVPLNWLVRGSHAQKFEVRNFQLLLGSDSFVTPAGKNESDRQGRLSDY